MLCGNVPPNAHVNKSMRSDDSPELRALQDTLSRQNADMRHKYEAFMASDALAIMASGGRRERSDSKDSTRERNARLSCKASIILSPCSI